MQVERPRYRWSYARSSLQFLGDVVRSSEPGHIRPFTLEEWDRLRLLDLRYLPRTLPDKDR
jgi:hypothetical protein